MRLRGALACGAAATVVLAGCGGSSHKASTASSISAPPTTTAASSTAARSGIAARLLTNNELPGFAAGSPTVDRSASAWVTTEQSAGPETARLDRLGFVGGAREDLTGPSGRGGVSLVEQFRSAGAARAELAAEAQAVENNNGSYNSPFPVTGIPGARGLGENGSPPGINVAFTSGDYYYLVGEQPPSVTAGVEHSLNAAAQHLYQRLKR